MIRTGSLSLSYPPHTLCHMDTGRPTTRIQMVVTETLNGTTTATAAPDTYKEKDQGKSHRE